MPKTASMAPAPRTRDVHEEVERRLTVAGQRYTAGRRSLVTVLVSAARPLTLRDIADSVPDMPPSSAYRNLDALQQGGVVHRISVGGDRAYFELAESLLGHHHHLICVACGAIEDVRLDAEFETTVDEVLTGAAAEAGFTPLHHNLDLYGHCPECIVGPSPASVRSEPARPSMALRAETVCYGHGLADREEARMSEHVHTDACYDHPEHTHADHADHCGQEEHSHADHCAEDHDHSDHCETPEHSHADHADHCDVEVHVHTEECCQAAA